MTAKKRDRRYSSLRQVMREAELDASEGKGADRHGDDQPFEKQITCIIERAGLSFCEGQAVKKIFEAARMRIKSDFATQTVLTTAFIVQNPAEREILGAINYLCANIIARRSK